MENSWIEVIYLAAHVAIVYAVAIPLLFAARLILDVIGGIIDAIAGRP